jgi:hypothetical protein
MIKPFPEKDYPLRIGKYKLIMLKGFGGYKYRLELIDDRKRWYIMDVKVIENAIDEMVTKKTKSLILYQFQEYNI